MSAREFPPVANDSPDSGVDYPCAGRRLAWPSTFGKRPDGLDHPTMTPCQFCGQPATIHITNILQQQKQQAHLCEACAKSKKLVPEHPGAAIDVQGLVQLVLGGAMTGGNAALTCPECGLKYSEFRDAGRLGCAADYDAFRGPLETLLERVHRRTRHTGKVPLRHGSRIAVAGMRAELAEAIAAERYEEAATLRDRIRQKEGADEPR